MQVRLDDDVAPELKRRANEHNGSGSNMANELLRIMLSIPRPDNVHPSSPALVIDAPPAPRIVTNRARVLR